MADLENVKILKVDVEAADAVKNIADLKENIKILKEALNDSSASFEDNQKVTEQLRANQAALRDAMYSTTGTMKDIAAAATGTSETYNGLVKRMADLKTQLRATDVSTTEGAAKFKELAGEINGINTRLKQMDALQGNYQRNVGMYTQKIANMGNAFKATAGAAGGMVNPIMGATTALKAMSATPIISILGLLVNIITKVVASMKQGEDQTAKMTDAMSGFQAIGDLVTKSLQAMGDMVAWVVKQFGKLASAIAGTNEQSEKRIAITQRELELAKSQRETTMANAEAERDIAELRAKAADKEQYTASQRLEFTKQAAELENGIAKRSYEDLKAQYEIIKAKNALRSSTADELKEEADAYAAMVRAETEYYNRIRTNNREQARLRKEEAADVKANVEEKKSALADWEAALAAGEKRSQEARKLLDEQQKEMDEWVQSQTDALVEEIDAYMEEQQRLDEFDKAMTEARIARAKEEAQQKMDAWMQAANVTSSILGSLADLYEADSKEGEKNAAKVKGLRIASATIDTISGAIAAYMNAQKTGLPPYISIPMGVASAAAVTAAGMANIAKIRSTDATGKSVASVSTAAPAPVLAVPEVRTLTTAQDMTRLNDMVSDQRVYILSSDLEADRKSTRAKVKESSY